MVWTLEPKHTIDMPSSYNFSAIRSFQSHKAKSLVTILEENYLIEILQSKLQNPKP